MSENEHGRNDENPDRGQASITVVEAGIGILLLLGVTFAFTLGVPTADSVKTETQLDRYADDATTLLANEPPRHQDQTRLSEITTSQSAFDRESEDVAERIGEILPDNVMFRLETQYGSLGYPLPDDVTTGEKTVLTPNGEVRLEVWYA